MRRNKILFTLPVVFDVLTVCTFEKVFFLYRDGEFIKVFDIFHYKQLLEKLEVLSAFF